MANVEKRVNCIIFLLFLSRLFLFFDVIFSLVDNGTCIPIFPPIWWHCVSNRLVQRWLQIYDYCVCWRSIRRGIRRKWTTSNLSISQTTQCPTQQVFFDFCEHWYGADSSTTRITEKYHQLLARRLYWPHFRLSGPEWFVQRRGYMHKIPVECSGGF